MQITKSHFDYLPFIHHMNSYKYNFFNSHFWKGHVVGFSYIFAASKCQMFALCTAKGTTFYP